MNKIPAGYILPSAAFSVPKKEISRYSFAGKKPKVGDVMYGVITALGQHTSLENRYGRIHQINEGTKAIFVYGNRYAPDYYEGLLPLVETPNVDLLARSGVIGVVQNKNAVIAEPTQITILGNVFNKDGELVNTKNYCLINPIKKEKSENRAKLILFIGTSMNSGKSTAASCACWALKNSGFNVRASKITGTASLKDILRMQDHGAEIVNDFSYFGYPSTYKLSEKELLTIFNNTDIKYANNPKNYWIVEIADGIFQRETAMLLKSPLVKNRIHKLVLAAGDAAGAVGGIEILKKEFGLTPNAISGVCSGSPLAVRELLAKIDVQVFNSMPPYDIEKIVEILK